MRSVWHGLKKFEKSLCDAKKFTIKANMDHYHLPLPVMNKYLKQVTPPKATSDLENQEHSLNKLMEFKKNGCRMLVIKYNPINNRRMAPLWDLFVNSGEMESILGIRVKSKSYQCLANTTPTQSQRLVGIASITSIIAPRFATFNTNQLSTSTILLHLL